jgi:Tol biopolymer transport system component
MKRSTLIRRLSISPVIVLVLLALGCGGTTQPALNPSNPQGKIVFSSNRGLGRSQAATPNSTGNIWIMNADGTGAVPLTMLTAAGSYDPVWSPDGTRIAFTSSRSLDGSDSAWGFDNATIWVMNADGTGASPLINTARGMGDRNDYAVWSPDGARIAFLEQHFSKYAPPCLYVSIVNADGAGLRNLTYCESLSLYRPQWSPDGTKLAYSTSTGVTVETYLPLNIWVWNADGTGVNGLSTMNHAESINPEWSPDGTRIAFASNRALDGSDAPNMNSTENIWVMNADGSGAKPLTHYTSLLGKSYAPRWSPDGTHILFSSNRALDGGDAPNINSTENIWIVNADGTGLAPLTTLTNAANTNPVWSPDGTKIAFDSARALDGSDAAITDGSNIWIMNADGTGAKPVTQTTPPVYNGTPQWRR